jgi:hypothetical protein
MDRWIAAAARLQPAHPVSARPAVCFLRVVSEQPKTLLFFGPPPRSVPLRTQAGSCKTRKEVTMRAKRLNEKQRQEVFHALVTTQDLGLMSVSESRQHIEKQFEITDEQLKQIEEEGLENEWPPLNEAVQPTII